MSLYPVFNVEKFESVPRGTPQSNGLNSSQIASQIGTGNAAKTIFLNQSTTKAFYLAQNANAPQGALFQYKSQQDRIAALQGNYIFNR
jgi:hypothetical protein